MSGEHFHKSSDYPAHSRKVVANVNQGVIQSQMPEHVTVTESALDRVNTDYPVTQLPNHHQHHHSSGDRPHPHERRRAHVYEQVEAAFSERGEMPQPVCTPTGVDSLKTSVKRNNHWSPGLAKDKAKIPAKSPAREKIEANQEKRKSFRNKRNSEFCLLNTSHSYAGEGRSVPQDHTAAMERDRRGSRDSNSQVGGVSCMQ